MQNTVTRTFVMLSLLSDLWKDDARWQANVRNSVDDGYTHVDEEGEGKNTRDLRCDELEFVEDGTVQVYDFMGSEHEQESFYGRDIVVYRVKATGELCVMYSEDLDGF